MARTTSAAVIELLGDDYNGTTVLTGFISTANVLVTRVAACAAAKGITLTAEELELMERWLSAHFYQQSDKGYSQRATLGASGTFGGKTDMGLNSTMYGQSAMTMDPSGCLAAITMRKTAGLLWLGKPPSDQIPYQNRD